ncbi:MAG: hypothetical protein HFG81_09740 [Dorea sp.]|uniref:hypothetical protein n=1 Tax=Sporofaciens musculi TaxID=2681861 RepID=UPI00216D9176|nr:hypothetical protein [Sporofaciens musculi]MCI9422983.1 hypothetical protein [Dorea sp.]
MDKNMIIFNGLRCKVNTKAAFVDMCMETPALASKMLASPVVRSECERKVCSLEDNEKSGVYALRVELNEEKREQIYEEIFGDKLEEERFQELSEIHRRLLEPIRVMHQKETKIDVIPFIVYGVVRNSRCKSMLLESLKGCEKECLKLFQGSEYQSAGFLRKFLLDERKAAKLMTGLLLLLRQEESEEQYRMVMNIIYAGYKSLKNVVKKLDYLTGKQFEELMRKDAMVEISLCQMVIEMVIAEDLDIPRLMDYQFCQVVCMLKIYEERRLNPQEMETDMAEGKRIYRKFLREHREPGAYYVSEFLETENQEMCERWERMEKLLNIFGMETRALYGIYLEKWEAEMLCTIFEEKDWERYKYVLLLGTLCKYIQQIEAMYESEIPEEIQYQRSCEESAVKSLEYERKRMEERLHKLERQKTDKEHELAEAERLIERLRRESMKKDEQHEREKTELNKLREFVFCKKGEGKAESTSDGIGSQMLDVGRLERSIVIGGHRNWQKKLRRCLPTSQFLSSDYMNFDPSVLHNKKYIIVNTDILKHGLYYKIMNERKKEQKVVYVHGNNVDRTLREIARQLG